MTKDHCSVYLPIFKVILTLNSKTWMCISLFFWSLLPGALFLFLFCRHQEVSTVINLHTFEWPTWSLSPSYNSDTPRLCITPFFINSSLLCLSTCDQVGRSNVKFPFTFNNFTSKTTLSLTFYLRKRRFNCNAQWP